MSMEDGRVVDDVGRSSGLDALDTERRVAGVAGRADWEDFGIGITLSVTARAHDED